MDRGAEKLLKETARVRERTRFVGMKCTRPSPSCWWSEKVTIRSGSPSLSLSRYTHIYIFSPSVSLSLSLSLSLSISISISISLSLSVSLFLVIDIFLRCSCLSRRRCNHEPMYPTNTSVIFANDINVEIERES